MTCSEIDVVVADSKPDVCLAVFDSRLPIYTMLRTDASLPVWKSTVRRVHCSRAGSVVGEEPASPRHRAGVASMAWRSAMIPHERAIKF